MKTTITILLIFISVSTFCQGTRTYQRQNTVKYTPTPVSEYNKVPNTLQKRYYENQEYLYSLMEWVLELRPQFKVQKFKDQLNDYYEMLKYLEDKDLARATADLKEIHFGIKELISEYNEYATNSNNSQHKEQNQSKKQYTKYYSGTQEVYTCASIYNIPNMTDGEQIGSACSGTVEIIEFINDKYYKVKSGSIVGYIWVGSFKD